MTSQVQDIKQAADILQIIGERVQLTRSGKNFRGLCPFHSEKSPSFFVSPDIQRYKCFGCGRSGDVLTFLQEYETMTFGEALQMLADRVGIRLEKHTFTPEDAHRNVLYEILDLSAEYYHYLLTKHEAGATARDYLKQRGMFSETIQSFRIGYAIDSWDALQKYLVGKKKYELSDIEKAGLVIQSTQSSYGKARFYDRFRGRIMFPLTNPQGKVVGFSGRLLEKNAKEAKYINTPETTLYHKSELLFGYSVLKNFIRKEEEVYVMEGEFDALSSYQAGVKHVVAIKGSAFTQQQCKLLSRSVKRIILSLDADDAGVEATKRAIVVAQEYDISLRVLPIEGGKDPDDLARENPALWREKSKQHVSVYEFLIAQALKKVDITTGEGKRLFTNEVVPVLFPITNAVERAHYTQQVAEILHVKEEAVEEELQRYQRKQALKGNGAVGRGDQRETQKQEKPMSQQETMERYVISLLLHHEPAEIQEKSQSLSSNMFTMPVHQKIVEAAQKKKISSMSAFLDLLPAECHAVVSELYLLDGQQEDSLDAKRDEWKTSVRRLESLAISNNVQQLSKKIAEIEKHEELTPEQETELDELRQQLMEANAKMVTSL